MLKYKKANEEGFILLQSLAQKIWQEHYITIISQAQIDYMLDGIYSYNSLLEQAHNGQEFYLIQLESTDEHIGFFAITHKDDHCLLNKLYMDLAFHGKGIGTLVMDVIVNMAKNRKMLKLFVNRQNFKSINFYFKNGFRIENVVETEIGNGFYMSDFVMVKALNV